MYHTGHETDEQFIDRCRSHLEGMTPYFCVGTLVRLFRLAEMPTPGDLAGMDEDMVDPFFPAPRIYEALDMAETRVRTGGDWRLDHSRAGAAPSPSSCYDWF